MNEMMIERVRSDGVAAIFHEDEGEGHFFLYRLSSREVLQQIQLYAAPTVPQIREEDVDIFWSRDEVKAGIAVWGRMRAILDISGKFGEACALKTPDSPAIQSLDTNYMFPEYVDRKSLEERRQYWKTALLHARPEVQISDQPISLCASHTKKKSTERCPLT
jgi:hypothetical protein